MPKITLPRAEMLDILDDDDLIISDTINGQSRWSTNHILIFKKDDKFYKTFYSHGSTESQDELPWEYEENVTCWEVAPVEKVVTVYEKVID